MFDDERGPGTEPAEPLDALDAGLCPARTLVSLHAAATAEVAGLDDDALLTAARDLEVARRSLDAASLHVLAELEHRDTCDEDYGLRTGTWLASETKLPPSPTRARVRLAVRLRSQLPDVDTALAAGRIGEPHARVLADGAANPRVSDAFIAAVPELLVEAESMLFDVWRQRVIALIAALDQDGSAPDDEPLDRNTLSMTRGFDATWNLKGQFTSAVGEAIHTALMAEADRLFLQRSKDEEVTDELPCPPRRTLLALALAELTRGHVAGRHKGAGPAAEVAVYMDAADASIAFWGDGIPIGDTDRLTLMCDPILRGYVLGLHRTVLDVARDHRLATATQRLAMAMRDGGCVFPGCDAPPSWTDAHHVLHWQHDGPTDLANLASLCRHHHGVSHRNGWTMRATHDEWFHWTTPKGDTFWSQRHGHQRAGPTPTPVKS
jgi:hypothetical protein